MAATKPCRNRCDKPGIDWAKPYNAHAYKLKQAICLVCHKTIIWDGMYCPCCSNRLRRYARNRRAARVVFRY